MHPAEFTRRAAAALVLSALALPAHAATFTVTNTNDSGAGSLRAAIDAANATTGNLHSIVFDLTDNSSINLLSELPGIDKPGIAIGRLDGPRVRLRAVNSTPLLRVGASNSLLTLSNLVLEGGARIGGGGCLLAEPPATSGSLVLNRVQVIACVGRRNDLFRSAQGAGVLAFGRGLNINDSDFQLNGFENRGEIEFNVAGAALAVLADSSVSVVIDGAFFADNAALGGAAGSAPVALGGALFIGGGARLNLERATFIDNRAAGRSGSASARGGAIFAEGSTFIEASAFVGGEARDGLVVVEAEDRSRTLQLRNTSFLGVNASAGSVVSSNLASVTLRNVSFAETAGGRAAGSELRVDALAGQAEPSVLRLSNSLFARADAGPAAACSVGPGVSIETSFNLSDRSAPGCDIATTARPLGTLDILYAAQGLGGGLELRDDSPAIDAGSPLTPDLADWRSCATRDAIGRSRPLDASGTGTPVCDIGAIEHPRTRLFGDGFESGL